MQAGNVNSLINSLKNTTENTKRKVSSAEEKGFKDVLKSTKEDNKTLSSNTTANGSENNKDIEEVSSKKETTVFTNEDIRTLTKAEEVRQDDKKDISSLLEMLIQLGGNSDIKFKLQKALEDGDLQAVQQAISGLLEKVMESSQLKLNSLIERSKVTLQDMLKPNEVANIGENLKGLAEKLSTDIISDDTLKNEIMTKLHNLETTDFDLNNDTLKETIVSKLTELISKGKNSDRKLKDFIENAALVAENPGEDKSEAESFNTLEVESSLEAKVEANKAVHTNELKEDKLLKGVLGEKKSSSKDLVSDKIAHVVARFENIRLDKATEATNDKPVITRNNFNMDFIKAVKFMDINNIKELSVKIIPRDLGEIVIRLTMDNGVMKANITAQNKDTYNLLNSQLPAISSQLSEQNMTIQSFSLSLGNGESFMSNGSGSQGKEGGQQNRQASRVVGVEEDNISEGYNLEESTVNILA